MQAQLKTLALLLTAALASCYVPAADQAHVPRVIPPADDVDAGSPSLLPSDAGPILLQCASYAFDGGAVIRLDLLAPPLGDDGGSYVLDGGFNLWVETGPLHPASSAGLPPGTVVEAAGVLAAGPGWIDGVSATFDGGSMEANLTYIPQYLEGSAQLGDSELTTIVCWSVQAHSFPTTDHFTYDADAGTCWDQLPGGERFAGWNYTQVVYLRETGDGQCGRLYQDLAEGDPSHPTLQGWDLRGADFSNATLHGADLRGARLEGANLTKLDLANATIEGTIDSYTQLPASCVATGNQVSCTR